MSWPLFLVLVAVLVLSVLGIVVVSSLLDEPLDESDPGQEPTAIPPTSARTTSPAPVTHLPTTAQPATAPSTAPPGKQGVHPGVLCAPLGAVGYTSAGTKMICSDHSANGTPYATAPTVGAPLVR